MTKNIFDAANEGDIEFVQQAISKGIDLSLKNEHGFTALHKAATGSNDTEKDVNLKIIKLLVEAGSTIDALSDDGRTPLYLLAEFSFTKEQLEFLVEKGANPNIQDSYGNHIVVNAMMPEVKEYLTQLTNYKEVESDKAQLAPLPEPVKLGPKEWRNVKTKLISAFKALNNQKLVAIQNAGYTQGDAFEDCTEEYHKRGDKSIFGFCFYTEQDSERGKETGVLPLGIWGAPEGGDSETIKVGNAVIQEFEKHGFEISWNGQADTRPLVLLHGIKNSGGLFGFLKR